ncbi:hypothetical protein BP6252_00527 [Coleophoma cylindrospora]|uniref:RNase H type-1 domain-containing protein n=1 Tax=Coleophoma cylindrospora TaxID=1849047 RepID=A0A3D8SQA8_9HELO|nr:hypothetical protein BP6252_00527 [Coleophoma cylindrospora]
MGQLKAALTIALALIKIDYLEGAGEQTDANILVAQLNRIASDIPGALVTRWLAWIRLFDFEVRHVKGYANKAADGLSRRPPTEQDLREEEQEEDLDKFINMELDDYIDYEMKAL